MAYQTIWYQSEIPNEIIDIIEKDIKKFDSELQESKLWGDIIDKSTRNSKNAWIPTTYWIAGFLWHYIERANRENFLYDLRNIDGENLQYTQYGPGEYYGWHNDAGIANQYKPQAIGNRGLEIVQDQINERAELVRKLSFSLQLSDFDEYEGGEFQLLDESGKMYFAPKKKGTIIIFDSRAQHRVRPVKSGVRKSIVGWVVGNRWK